MLVSSYDAPSPVQSSALVPSPRHEGALALEVTRLLHQPFSPTAWLVSTKRKKLRTRGLQIALNLDDGESGRKARGRKEEV